MDKIKQRTVKSSQVTLTELMIPSYANFGGKIHGGLILSLMDKVAYATASKHAGTYCVTVSVEAVDFKQAVDVGDLVFLRASVNYVGRTSLVIGIQVTAENVKEGTVKHTNTSYFTMVAKDDEGNLVEVPELILETPVEVRRYVDAMHRRRMKQERKEELDALEKDFKIEKVIDLLDKQRCQIFSSLE